ncbi:MAG: Stp1/IreP family PP2C-type Ser/Thr phosphatase [Coriobacteriales bacterium]
MSFNFTKPTMPRSYAARSDVGSVREHNEDSYLVKTPLFVVADGMGGHEAGEVASSIAVTTMESHAPKSTSPEALAAAVIKANEAVLRGAQDGTGKPGMGTTLTAAFVFEDEATIAQVGDSRAYLLHDGQLQRITRDHSLVADLIEQGRLTEAEARFHPQRSVITRALGSDPSMQPDLYTLHVEEGDRLLLCSDGLSSMIPDGDIEAILLDNPVPAQACDALVEEAIIAGGLDNVTVIVIDPLGDPPTEDEEEAPVEERIVGAPEDDEDDAQAIPATPAAAPAAAVDAATAGAPAAAARKNGKGGKHHKPKRKGRMAPFIWALAFVLILAAAGFGFYAFAQNSYFIIAEDGIVSVYRGLPGEFAGFSVSWLESQAPDIDVTKLTPMVQGNLKSGISVNSLDEANEKISEFRQQTTKG